MSLQRVIQRVQTLFDDRGETWCDKDYVIAFLAINNEDLQSRLESQELSYLEDSIVLSNVPAGTADLSSYQGDGQELDDMMTPITLEWRRVGETDDDWKPINRVDKILDADSANQSIEGVASWSWKKGITKLSKSSIAFDLRVTCELLPDVLQSDSDNYIKGMTNVLAYWTAEMICNDRGGPTLSRRALWFAARGERALTDVEITLSKQEHQNVPRRLGGRRRRFGPGSMPFFGVIEQSSSGSVPAPGGAAVKTYLLIPVPDGSTTLFQSPVDLTPSHMVYRNGIKMSTNAPDGYSYAGTMVTFIVAPVIGDILEVVQ